MERDIVRKLSDELAQQIVSERQVVYVLVELRKLLEGRHTLDEYDVLKLCCDWAVHPKLSRAPANRIVRLFDEYEAKYRHESVGVAQAGMPELVEFCGHKQFRVQFIDACESNGVAAGAPKDDDWWRSFLRQYSEVVKDCPLEANADHTMYVTQVKATAIPPESIGLLKRKPWQFGICWAWYRKDIEIPGTVVSLF